MRTMLSFDIALLKQKKNNILWLLAGNLLYLVSILIPYMDRANISIVLNLIMGSMNTYCIMEILVVNSLSSNLTGSNYSIYRYFPLRRRDYIFSKCFFVLLITILQAVMIAAREALASAAGIKKWNVDSVIVLCLITAIIILVLSSVIMVTAYNGRVFHFSGIMTVATISGCVSALTLGSTEYGSIVDWNGWLIGTGICFVIFIISMFISYLIAKYSSL